MDKPTCSFKDCSIPGLSQGRCPTHEKLIARYWQKVIPGDECWGWDGGLMHGYGRVSANGKTYVAHRLAYEMAKGPIGDEMMIDHACHNRECTNPEHLREVTPQQNSQHRIGKNPNNTSGRHGVHWSTASNKWHATVHYGPKVYYAGAYDDLDEAAEAARLKRLELFTHNDRDRR